MGTEYRRKGGRLTCVGTGITLAEHITPLSRSYIENADVVFSLMSHGVVERWVEGLNDDVRSLQGFYAAGSDRPESYRRMVAAMLAEVRAGKNVVGAFYGHPGVFAVVPHRAIAIARREGFSAHMEPGVSAEDCLYADLGIDPGKYGCQQFEATQFMIFKRQIDPTACLILWQVGVVGDLTVSRFDTNASRLQLLTERLLEIHPADHVVTLYEANTLPVSRPRIDHLPLRDLPGARTTLHSTLVIPPSEALQRDQQMIDRLSDLEQPDTPHFESRQPGSRQPESRQPRAPVELQHSANPSNQGDIHESAT